MLFKCLWAEHLQLFTFYVLASPLYKLIISNKSQSNYNITITCTIEPNS